MKTWAIDLDADQLDMLAFCVGVMGQMMSDDLKDGKVHGYRSVCEHGHKRGGKAQLQADVKTANRLLAAIYKAQVNLAVASAKPARRKTKGGEVMTQPRRPYCDRCGSKHVQAAWWVEWLDDGSQRAVERCMHLDNDAYCLECNDYTSVSFRAIEIPHIGLTQGR